MTNRSGIVLAGGASRRFGSNKLAEPIDGTPLLDRAIGALAGIVDEIIVVVAPNQAEPRPAPAGPTPLQVVADPEPFGGPLVGLRAGLHAARGATVIVVGGDMPSMRPSVLELLLARPPAALADQDGVRRPLPCSLERAAALLAADALLASGERRLRALLTSVGTTMVPWAEWQPQDPAGLTLVDIDERSDLP